MGVSLARLLVDMSRADLDAIARVWGVPNSEPRGLAAAVYRQMIDPLVAKQILDQLTPTERAVLQRMMSVGDAVRATDLLRTLPLSDDALMHVLGQLTHLGIVWRIGVTERRSGRETGGEWLWAVPSDLARNLRFDRYPISRESKAGVSVSDPPPLRVLTGIVAPPVDVLDVAQAITTLGEAPRHDTSGPVPSAGTDSWLVAPRTLVEWVGMALGVVVRERRQIVPGPRWADWLQIGPRERVRAVTRLWLIEDRMPGTAPSPIRHALRQVLRDVEPRQWYDVNSVARRAAWSIGQGSSRIAPAVESRDGRPGTLISRRDLDQATQMLSWLSVVRVARAPSGRILGLHVTEAGEVALR